MFSFFKKYKYKTLLDAHELLECILWTRGFYELLFCAHSAYTTNFRQQHKVKSGCSVSSSYCEGAAVYGRSWCHSCQSWVVDIATLLWFVNCAMCLCAASVFSKQKSTECILLTVQEAGGAVWLAEFRWVLLVLFPSLCVYMKRPGCESALDPCYSVHTAPGEAQMSGLHSK